MNFIYHIMKIVYKRSRIEKNEVIWRYV